MTTLQPGVYEGVIQRNDVRQINGKEFVELLVEVEDNFERFTVPTRIWLTDKAMNMARAALKRCGFDVAREEIGDLANEHEYLQGRPVTIKVESHAKYGLQGSIDLDRVSAKKLGDLQRRLRSADDDGSPVVPAEPPPVSTEPPDDVAAAYERENSVPLTPENRAELTEKAKADGSDIPF